MVIIDSIHESGRQDGKITVLIKREPVLNFDKENLAAVQSIEIIDNGVGFTSKNRDSFDTFYSEMKMTKGGKGFGRFMFLKYFNRVTVNSVYKAKNNEFRERRFDFGKQYDIIINENDSLSNKTDTETHIYIDDILDNKYFDKGIDTIARKLLERLLIFFVDDSFSCPEIKVVDTGDFDKTIILNHYINQDNSDIKLLDTKPYDIVSSASQAAYHLLLRYLKYYMPKIRKVKYV